MIIVPKWDKRYLLQAAEISNWSKDPSTQMGAVLVRPNNSVSSVGINGFPKNMPDDPDLYLNREEKYDRVIHSEMNAILNSQDITMEGYTLYTWPLLPCHRCFVHIIQKGIIRIVAPIATPDQLSRWGESFDKTRKYATECGIEVSEYPVKSIKE